MKWWQLKKRNADLERELQSDLELEEEEQREKGLPPEEARHAARRAFGNTTLIREQTHEAWGWATTERLWQDIRYALRQLRRAPGFSIVAMMTLALGIGATTAIFTLVYDVMLRPLPFPHPDRLVTLEEKVAEWSNIYPTVPVSANHFTFWQQHSRSFDSMAIMEQVTLPLGGSGRPLQVQAVLATPGIFSVLQVQPAVGRKFTIAEAHERLAVLTYDLWREQFGGKSDILGKTIVLDGFPYAVIGVMPQSFHIPSIQTMGTIGNASRQLPIGILLPMAFSKERLAEQMGDLNYFGLARLKPGTSVAVANAELNALQHRISVNLPPGGEATLSSVVTPFQEQLVGNNQKPLMILLAAVAGLLLVGCVNVTNLLLSRAISRKRQFAVAAALGASRAEMVRMAIREVAVLAVLGGGLGILAAAIVPGMQRYLPPALDFRGSLHLDWVGVICALLLVVLATVAAGVAPAFMVSGTAPHEVLHSDSRLTSESLSSRRARRALIAVESAVSVALVLTTGLLIASLVKLMDVDRGFTTERTITATVDLPSESYRDDQHRVTFYREVLQHLNGLAGMQHAAFTSVLPLTAGGWGEVARVTGDSRPTPQLPIETVHSVSPQYFSAIHLRLIAGKAFSEGDWGKNLAVVSQKTARTLWPGKDPLGQQMSWWSAAKNEKPFTVIGVAAAARTVSLEKPDPMLIYVPYWYRCDSISGLVVRTRRESSEMAEVIRQTIWSIDRGVPVPTVRALGGIVADSVANRRFEMDVLRLFAASALLLAGLGVYGVLTYSVSQRHREIGLRLALGAQRANVYWLVLRDGLLPVAIGAVAGIAVAFGSARLVSGLLYQISPYDPVLSAGAVGVLLAVGATACLLPAGRAAAVEPMRALRTE